jgi:hypothetical protein
MIHDQAHEIMNFRAKRRNDRVEGLDHVARDLEQKLKRPPDGVVIVGDGDLMWPDVGHSLTPNFDPGALGAGPTVTGLDAGRRGIF